MDAFLPSEIGRLIYGYLRSHCGQNLADEFFKSCPSMKECRLMKQRYARNFHTTVQDLTLETILDQYSKLCSLIFKYSDENERRVHKNVLNLLEKILNKRQFQSSDSASNALKDVQNIPQHRNISDAQVVNEARGLENKPSSAPVRSVDNNSENHKNVKVSCPKKKSIAVNPTRGQISCISNIPDTVEPKNDSTGLSSIHGEANVFQFSSTGATCITQQESQMLPSKEQQTTSPKNSIGIPSNISSKVSVLNSNQKSVFDPTNDAYVLQEALKRSSNANHELDRFNEAEISYSPLVRDVVQDTGETKMDEDSTSSEELIPVTRRTVHITNSQNQLTSKANNSVLLCEPSSKNDDSKFRANLSSASSENSLSAVSNSSSTSDSTSSYSSNSEVCRDGTFVADEEKNCREKQLFANVDNKEDGELSSSGSLETISSDDLSIFHDQEKRRTPTSSDKDKIPSPPLSTCQMQKSVDETDISKTTGAIPEKLKETALSEEALRIFENLSKDFKYRPPYSSPAKSKELLHRTALSPFAKMYITPTKSNILNSAVYCRSVMSNTTVSSLNSNDRRSIFSPVSTGDTPNLKNSAQSDEISLRRFAKKGHIENKADYKQFLPTKEEKKTILAKRRENYDPKSLSSPIQKKKVEEKRNTASKSKINPYLNINSASRMIQVAKNKELDRKKVVRVFVEDTNEIAELDISQEFLIYHRKSTCLVDYSSA